ncbi:hypothetical protein chiPu_0032091, partial [Chiloscyllium punctatum]|nr:hypothetical protein [Chiloscyllium punctatum]
MMSQQVSMNQDVIDPAIAGRRQEDDFVSHGVQSVFGRRAAEFAAIDDDAIEIA